MAFFHSDSLNIYSGMYELQTTWGENPCFVGNWRNISPFHTSCVVYATIHWWWCLNRHSVQPKNICSLVVMAISQKKICCECLVNTRCVLLHTTLSSGWYFMGPMAIFCSWTSLSQTKLVISNKPHFARVSVNFDV